MRALLFVAVAGVAGLSVPNIYASHMVLARDVPNLIWGSDTAGSKVTASLPGASVSTNTDATGVWRLQLPAQKASITPVTVTITTSVPGQTPITLEDVLFGELFVCSGQSNMQLTVDSTVNRSQYEAESDKFGPILRILQVELVPGFENITTPQSTTTLSIAWARVGAASVGPMSAVCYYYGRESVLANPQVPVGLLASSWGGTAINVWMDPTSAQACGAASKDSSFQNPDPGLGYLKGLKQLGFPTHDSCLYYSMIVPLQYLRVTGMLWYQGEANAGDPEGYARCFPAMIKQWRSAWDQASGVAAVSPFFFVQLSSWAAGDGGVIATQRIAQQAAFSLPSVGMAVAADIGDPASPVHPIHPIMKQEVARRLYLAARRILYNQTQVPAEGPRVIKLVTDPWDASWGDYHQGVGISNVCTPGSGFFCLGIRVFFDQALVLHPSYEMLNGNQASFELLTSNGATQPVGLTGVSTSDPTMLQLNVTVVVGPVSKAVLRYGWRDYPTMPLTNTLGQPAPSFNISISA